jgi:hypothetical protein
MQKPEDGIDHINIYSKGHTLLGRALSNWDECHIEISIGFFRTIEGLIFYLGSFDERLRHCTGFEAKKLGEKVDRKIRLPEDVFKRFIIAAMYRKVENDDGLRSALINSDLPFDHYYNFSGKIIRPTKWMWQVEEWEKIRKNLKTSGTCYE